MLRNPLPRVLLAASLLAAPACWAAAPAGEEAPGPVVAVDSFHQALKAGDTDGALKLLAEDASIFEQGFVDQTRADYSGAHIAADAAFAKGTKFQVQERHILWLGDNAACVISKTRTQGSYQGQAIDLIGTESMVLQRSGNNWSIEHIHWSAHPADDKH